MALLLASALLLGALSSDGSPPSPVEETTTDAPTADTPSATPYGIWDRLAECESSGRWWISTGNGYFGGLQMDMVFWRRHGGQRYAARPDYASREAQIAVARTGLAVQGWGAWPWCSRHLGLR